MSREIIDDGVAREQADLRAEFEAEFEPNSSEDDLQVLDVAGDAHARRRDERKNECQD
jgi:hypothetical protein